MRPWVTAVVALLGGACVPKVRGPEDQLAIVRDIRFDGNGGALAGTADYAVRSAMDQQESPGFWWVAPRARAVRLDEDVLRTDGWRVETWYAHNGYFDARFLGWDIVTLRQRKNRPAIVRLVGHVSEGPETTVRSVSWEGMEVIGKPLLRQLDGARPLVDGARFSLGDHEDTAAMALGRLQERSFARATLTAEVDAYPEEYAVDVEYTGTPGPACTFGELILEGDFEMVPQELVRAEIPIEEGANFRASKLVVTQRNLFALGTFSLVAVDPIFDDPDLPQDVIPVRVRLEESEPRQLRLGGGVGIENGQEEIHLKADFSHNNLLRRLWRLHATAELGYTWLLQFSELIGAEVVTGLVGGATTDLGLNVVVPRAPWSAWTWENDVGFKLDITESYQSGSPDASTLLRWRVSPLWTLGFGYRAEYNWRFNEAEGVEEAASAGGLFDDTDRYFLTSPTQFVTYDSRDDVLSPARGALWTLEFAEAGPPGSFDFLRVYGEARGYRGLGRTIDKWFGWRPDLTVAARLGGGIIQPYRLFGEDRAQVPLPERLYLGGSSSVRGWVRDRLGPRVYSCDEGDTWLAGEPGTTPCDGATVVPVGGLASAFGGMEFRGTWAGGIGAVLFSDLGMVWSSPSDLQGLLPTPTVGTGLRYDTPIGPLRLDAALRLDKWVAPFRDYDLFDEEPTFQIHFGLSEAY